MYLPVTYSNFTIYVNKNYLKNFSPIFRETKVLSCLQIEPRSLNVDFFAAYIFNFPLADVSTEIIVYLCVQVYLNTRGNKDIKLNVTRCYKLVDKILQIQIRVI